MKKYKSIIMILSMLIIFFSGNTNIIKAEENNQPLPDNNPTVNNDVNQNNQNPPKQTKKRTKKVQAQKNAPQENNEANANENPNNDATKNEEPSPTPNEPPATANQTESIPQKKQTKPSKKNKITVTEPQPLSLDSLYEIAGPLTNKEPSADQNSQNNNEPPKESHTVPSDLPEVESSDIVLPQMTASNENKEKNDLIPGIVAWAFIGIGIAIILFVLIKGSRHSNKDISINNSPSKKKKNKSRLLSDKYYKD